MAESKNHNENLTPADRFQAIYQPALETQRIIGYMRDNPLCEEGEFRRNTGIAYLNPKFPELENLAGGIITTRSQVHETYKAIREESGIARASVAEVLYQNAIGHTGYFHQGPLEITHLDNPLALAITLTNPDFQKLRQRDIGGYYNHDVAITINGNVYHTPFIAVRSDADIPQDKIFKHEMLHAENHLISTSFAFPERVKYWGKDTGGYVDEDRIIKWWRASKKDTQAVIEMKTLTNYANMLNVCLTFVKDEVVVRLKNDDPISPIVTKNTSYDPLANGFKELDKSEVGTQVWLDHTARVANITQAVNRVFNAYKHFNIKSRVNILPYMLVRTPMYEWTKMLNETGITAEAEILNLLAGKKSSHNQITEFMSNSGQLNTHELARLLV
jgi:hypothetical protein